VLVSNDHFSANILESVCEIISKICIIFDKFVTKYLVSSFFDSQCVRITVKPEIFACPLFREFRDLGKFAKITGREYLTGRPNLAY